MAGWLAGQVGGFCSDTASSSVCSCPPGTASYLSSSAPQKLLVTAHESGMSVAFWIRSDASTVSAFRDAVHCRDPQSAKPGFTVGFDGKSNRARYAVLPAASATPTATLQEDPFVRKYAGGWVHYALVHDKGTTKVSLYRDGVLVKSSASVQYPWSGESLECMVGASFSAQQQFSGEVTMFYYWQGVLTPRELAYTREKGSPQHASPDVSVVGALSSQCRDMDECALDMYTCPQDLQTCLNTDGSYVCLGDKNESGAVLQDVDECAAETNPCGSNMSCYNVIGGYSCFCRNSTSYTASFSGSNSLSLPAYTRLGADGLTVSLWVRTRTLEDRLQPLLECFPQATGSGPDATFFLVAFNARTNTFKYMPVKNGLQVMIVEHADTSALYTGGWAHFAVVHDNLNVVSLYRDGALVTTARATYTFKDSSTADCRMGSAATWQLNNLTGWMQGVFMWARALDASEVRQWSACASVCASSMLKHVVRLCAHVYLCSPICVCTYACVLLSRKIHIHACTCTHAYTILYIYMYKPGCMLASMHELHIERRGALDTRSPQEAPKLCPKRPPL